MSNTKQYKNNQQNQVIFADVKPRTLPNKNASNTILENAIIIRKWDAVSFGQTVPTELPRITRTTTAKKPAVPTRYVSAKITDDRKKIKQSITTNKGTIQLKIESKKEEIIPAIIIDTKKTEQQLDSENVNNEESRFDRNQPLSGEISSDLIKLTTNYDTINNGTVVSELRPNITNQKRKKKIELQIDEKNDEVISNQEAFDLLSKIKGGSTPISIGPMPLSLQVCSYR